MQTVEIKQTELNRDYAGWYVTDSDLDPSEWTWQNRGNGPEIVKPSDARGPFETEAEAAEFADKQPLFCSHCGDPLPPCKPDCPPLTNDQRGKLLCEYCYEHEDEDE
jgi:hypothetical protein